MPAVAWQANIVATFAVVVAVVAVAIAFAVVCLSQNRNRQQVYLHLPTVHSSRIPERCGSKSCRQATIICHIDTYLIQIRIHTYI